MSKYRVIRGGSYANLTRNLRTSYRNGGVPEERDRSLGFRIVVVRRKQ